MRKIWYVVLLVGLSLMYVAFTSDHIRNVDNAWLWVAVQDHGNIIIDLFMLYIGSRVFNHVRTHHIQTSTENITRDTTLIMGFWLIAIAIVVAQ